MLNLHTVTVHTLTLPPHHATNCYVIGGDAEAVLIDPIYAPGGPLEQCLAQNGIRSLRYAAVSHPHPDHYGGLDLLLRKYGGMLLCHPEAGDAPAFGIPDSLRIRRCSGGETIELAGGMIQVLHTPGHSRAHLSFYIPQEAILFSGDTILGRGTSIISPPEGDMAQYLETLHALASMEIRSICPAHGPVIDRKAHQRIQWYIAHRLMREARVLEALAEGLSEVAPITRRIYNEEDFHMHGYDLQPRAERTVLAHLLKLEKEGVVYRENGAQGVRYSLV